MFVNNTVFDFIQFRADCSGDREAVCDFDTGRRWSFAELNRRAGSMAAFLCEELGLRKGDRIAFCSENNIAFIDAFFMSYKTGIIITSYNCMMSISELTKLVARETPKVVFYSGERRRLIEPFRNDSAPYDYIAVRGLADRRDHCNYEDVVNYRSRRSVVLTPPDFDDIQMLIHTGGTTGLPKAAMMSYQAIFNNAISAILSVNISCDDCALQLLPFFHTAGWNSLMLPTLVAGGRIVYTSSFQPETLLRAIADERPTVCIGVETMYRRMARHPNFGMTDLSCFRWMVNGAAPISRAVLETYWRRDVKMVNAYGMTEIGPENMAPPVEIMSPGEIEAKWNSVGKPMLFNHLRVVDEEGRDLPPGEEGELLFSGRLTFSGYWRDKEQTESIVRKGWIHTGDIGRRDEDGYYYICGRKKNMFISGGENIFPIEIEQALTSHPLVESACVFGVPDDNWGEVGKALIVTEPGAAISKEELLALVKRECSGIKIPKYIQFVSDIPKNTAGKLDLAAVQRVYGYGADEEPQIRTLNREDID